MNESPTAQTPSGGDFSIVLVGEGRIAEKLAAALARSTSFVRQTWEMVRRTDGIRSARLVIAAMDLPDLEPLLELGADCYRRGVSFLPLWVEFGEGRVGPLVSPDASGCLACAESRRLHNCHRRTEYCEALAESAKRGAANPWLLSASVNVLVEVAVAWSDSLRKSESPREHEIFLMNLSTLACAPHRFLPAPSCHVCGGLPEDEAGAARIDLGTPRWADRTTWRVTDVGKQKDALAARYVDSRTGIASVVDVDITTPLCAVGSARFRVSDPSAKEQWGAGLTHSFERSQAVAILEVVERYGGLQPRGKRTNVVATKRELGEDAVDPRDFILYGDEQYAMERFPCVRFHDDLRLRWVWAHSFRGQRSVLVPEQLAYYDASSFDRQSLFVIESSSGCAIGGCLEEAIFYGLLEVIERDAILRTWYSRTAPAAFDLETVQQPDLGACIDRLRDVTRYDVRALDVTQEFGVTSVWLLAVNAKDDTHRLLCAARAHPVPELAISGALGELAGTILFHREQSIVRRAELLRMIADPSLIRECLDHSLVAGLPEVFDRYSFLLTEPATRPLASCSAFQPVLGTAGMIDLAKTCRRLVDRIIDAGFDVLVVDQTTPEQGDFELRTVKVLVPGLLPITYSQRLRRVSGAKRLRHVEAVNPHLHPFV